MARIFFFLCICNFCIIFFFFFFSVHFNVHRWSMTWSQDGMQLNYQKIWLHNRWQSRFGHFIWSAAFSTDNDTMWNGSFVLGATPHWYSVIVNKIYLRLTLSLFFSLCVCASLVVSLISTWTKIYLPKSKISGDNYRIVYSDCKRSTNLNLTFSVHISILMPNEKVQRMKDRKTKWSRKRKCNGIEQNTVKKKDAEREKKRTENQLS